MTQTVRKFTMIAGFAAALAYIVYFFFVKKITNLLAQCLHRLVR